MDPCTACMGCMRCGPQSKHPLLSGENRGTRERATNHDYSNMRCIQRINSASRVRSSPPTGRGARGVDMVTILMLANTCTNEFALRPRAKAESKKGVRNCQAIHGAKKDFPRLQQRCHMLSHRPPLSPLGNHIIHCMGDHIIIHNMANHIMRWAMFGECTCVPLNPATVGTMYCGSSLPAYPIFV